MKKVIEEAKQAGEIDDFSFNAVVKTLKQEEENLRQAHHLLREAKPKKEL